MNHFFLFPFETRAGFFRKLPKMLSQSLSHVHTIIGFTPSQLFLLWTEEKLGVGKRSFSLCDFAPTFLF